MNKKFYVMLVCLMFAVAVLPTASTATEIGTLSTVDNANNFVLVERNMTTSDLSELIGISLDEDDTLYISYYNETGDLNSTSIAAYEDADEVIWFNISIADVNATYRLIYFDDEEITDEDDATKALYITDTISDEEFIFIVNIPDGIQFTYDKYSFEYDEEQFVVYNSNGKEVGNITSYNYSATYKAYGMDYESDSTSHALVFVGETVHTKKPTTIAGKRVTESKWYWFDATTPFNMYAEETSDYTLITSKDGYIAFDIYNDYGMLSKYTAGRTPFRMTSDGLEYGTPKWYWPWTYTWSAVSTDVSSMSSIDVGMVEYIYVSEETGAEDNDEILRDNYGVLCSVGEETAVSGIMNTFRMWRARTPKISARTAKTVFG